MKSVWLIIYYLLSKKVSLKIFLAFKHGFHHLLVSNLIIIY